MGPSKADLERGFSNETPKSDREEKMEEWMETCKEEEKQDGFIERNNYGDRL